MTALASHLAPDLTLIPLDTGSDQQGEGATDPRAALAAGDDAAWADIVVRFRPLLLSRARRHRLSPEEAADMSQDIWVRLLQHAATVRDPERLAGWLATTANRECIAVRRRAWREQPSDSHVEGIFEQDCEERLDAESRARALRAAVSRLPLRERRLMEVLLEPEPVPYSEISIRLQMPVGSIGPVRARALRRLRGYLEDDAALSSESAGPRSRAQGARSSAA